MPLDSDELGARIAWLCQVLRSASPETLDTACAIASDMLADDAGADTATDESLIDGIRWGHRAAHICEKQGGVILRIRAQGGSAVSHEFQHAPSDATLAGVARMIEQALTEKVPS